MKSKFWRDRKRTNRIISSALVGLMVFSTPITSFAATKVYAPQPLDVRFYGSAYKDLQKAFGTNEDALKNHYYTYGKKEGRAANLTEAIAKNQVMNMIVAFVEYNRDYYLSHGLETNFPYFNVDAYLAANPDVAELVGNDRYKALLHYLDYGIYEGRSCETGFDPAVAIVAQTDSLSASGLSIPEVFASYKAATGVANTSGIRLGVTDRNVLAVKWVCPCAPTADKTFVDAYFKGGKKSNAVVINNGTETVITSGINDSVNNKDGIYEDKPSSHKPSSDKPTKPVITLPRTYTMMVYMAGQDLETDHMQGTNSILDMCIGAGLSEENMNIMLCAGGTSAWQNFYFHDAGNDGKTKVYQLDGDAIKKAWEQMRETYAPNMKYEDFLKNPWGAIADKIGVDIADPAKAKEVTQIAVHNLIKAETFAKVADFDEEKSMGYSDTLTAFMDVCERKAKADMYGLSFWSHGNGVIGGVCEDKTNPDASFLTVKEMKEALENSHIISSGNKLSLLAYDACLMGNLETANYLKDYYDYMIASEAVTYASMSYDETLPLISNLLKRNDKKASEIGNLVAQDMMEHSVEKQINKDIPMATYAIYDAKIIQNASDKINDLSRELSDAIFNVYPTEIYEAINDAELRSSQMNKLDSFQKNYSYVDALDFLTKLQKELNEKLGTETPTKKMFKEHISDLLDETIEAVRLYATSGYTMQYYGDKTTPDGTPVYVTSDNKIQDTLFDALQEDSLKENLSGSTLFVPVSDVDYEQLIESYKDYFGDQVDWGSYATLMENYFHDYLDSQDEKARREALHDNLDYNEIFEEVKFDTIQKVDPEEKSVTPIKYLMAVFKDNYTVEDEVNKNIKYKIDEENAVECDASTKNPYLDFMEAAKTVQVYVAHKFKITQTDYEKDPSTGVVISSNSHELDKPADVIIGKVEIGKDHVGTYTSEDGEEHTAINVLADTLKQATGYLVTGVSQAISSNPVDIVDMVMDWAQKYSLTDSIKHKISEALGLTNGEDDVDTQVEAFAGTAYDSNDKEVELTGEKRYLVFKKNGDNYTYVGTVDHAERNDEETEDILTRKDNANFVSFYHYIVQDNEIKCLEEQSGENSSYQITDAAQYDVTNPDTLTITERYISAENNIENDPYNEYLIGANDLIENGGAFTGLVTFPTEEQQEIGVDQETIGRALDDTAVGDVPEQQNQGMIGTKLTEEAANVDAVNEDSLNADSVDMSSGVEDESATDIQIEADVVEWVSDVTGSESESTYEADELSQNQDVNANQPVSAETVVTDAEATQEVTETVLSDNTENIEFVDPANESSAETTEIPSEPEFVMPEQDMSYEVVAETENQTEPPVQEDNSATSENESTPVEQTVSEEANVSSDEEDA